MLTSGWDVFPSLIAAEFETLIRGQGKEIRVLGTDAFHCKELYAASTCPLIELPGILMLGLHYGFEKRNARREVLHLLFLE